MRRALSWLLVLVMVFSMVPMAAFADTADVWTVEGSYAVVGGNYYEFAPTSAGKYTFTSADGVTFAVDNGAYYVLGSDLETWSTEMQGDGGSIGITPNADTVITITKADAKPAIEYDIYENNDNPSYFIFSPCLEIDENGKYALVCLSEPVNIAGMFGAKYADVSTGTYIDYSNALAEYVANAVTIGNKLYTYNTYDIRQMLEHLSIQNDWVGLGFITSVDEFFVSGSANHKDTRTETYGDYEYVFCNNCDDLVSSTQPGLLEDNPIAVDLSWEETVGTASVTAGYYYSFDATEGELFVNDQQWWYNLTDDGRAVTQVWVEDESEGPVTVEIKWVKPAPEVPATLAEQIAEASKLANKEHLPYESTITGTIIDVPQASSYNEGQYRFNVSDGTNTLTCYFVPVTGGTPAKGATVTVTGYLTAHNGSAQFDSTAAAVVIKEAEPEDVPADPEANSVLTIEEAIALGASKAHNTYTTGKYYVTGVITEVYNEQYGNMRLTDEAGNILTVYGSYSADGDVRYDSMDVKPVAGDTVTVYGIIGQYSGTSQIKNGWITEHVPAGGEEPVEPEVPADPEANSVLTIEEAIALGASKAHNTYTTGKYYVTGVITEVYNEQYGNMHLTDEAGNILTVYGSYSADGDVRYDSMDVKPVAGDTVTVYGIIGQYSGTSQIKNGWITEHIPAGGEEPEDPDTTGAINIVIADYASENGWENGVQYPTIEKDGITVTAAGGENTGKYYNNGTNWRLYQTEAATVTISADSSIATVKVTYTSSNSGELQLDGVTVASDETVAVNGNSVTFAVGGTAAKQNGQARITAIEVVLGGSAPSEPIPGESAENPIYPEWVWNEEYTEATCEVTLGKGTWYFADWTMAGKDLLVNGEPYDYIPGTPRMSPSTWTITNDGAEAVYVLKIVTPMGDQSNPEIIDSLFYSSFTASLAEGDSDGYYYLYTAEGDGSITMYITDIPEGITGDIVAYNLNTYQMLTLLADGVDNAGLELTMEVSEGDQIQIQVMVAPDDSWNIAAADITWFGTFTAKPGSEANPIFVEDENWDTSAVIEFTYEIPAGETVYFQGRLGGTTLEMDAKDLIVMIDGVQVNAENGIITYEIAAGEGFFAPPNQIVITNNGNEAVAADMSFTYAVGSDSNPAELVIGENVAKPGNGGAGYVYSWTAEEDGELTITMNGDNWTFVINNMTAYAYGDNHFASDGVNTETVSVAAGDEIQIVIGTEDWTAAEISFTAAFAGDGACKHKGLVHMEAVAPGCHYNGNIEHWYCNDCETVWTDEALTQISNHMSVIVPMTGDDSMLSHFEAVEPGCHFNGNIEYWVCYKCEQVWQDAALTQLTNIKNVTLPATHEPEAIHVEAKAPTCSEGGNIEYWYCEECEQVWQDEALTQLTNIKNVQLGKIDHTALVHMEAVEPGCHFNGNIEYWVCYACEQVWQDEALTQLTNIKNVVIPATHNPEAVKVEAVAPTCFTEGNVEYWYCEECNGYWLDEACTQITNRLSVKLGALEHTNIVHVEAVEPGCHYNGNIEHWYCKDCETVWTDEALTQISNHMSVILPMTGDDSLLVHMEAVEPGCHYNGNIEHWVCYKCEQVWQDEALTQLTNIKNVVVPATHNPEAVKVDAVEPGCHYDGNVEYWTCYECDQVWLDAALTQLSNIKNIVVPATHEPEAIHVEAKAPTCSEGGNIEYWYCEECEQVWQDEALTQLTNIKNVQIPMVDHTLLVHMDAVEPGCHYEGNIEYWICYACEQVWQDEALTQLTNVKNVVIPATGEGEVVHVEAVEPGCDKEGNIEHWYCKDCDQVWTDEALTQLSNHMSVKLGITHNVVHMDAVEPGCHYNGNIEYWYCPDCGTYWADELCHVVTNSKSVVIPAVGGEVIHVPYAAPSCMEGNMEFWFCEECEQVWQDEALTQLTNIKNVIIPATGDHDIDMNNLIWSWAADKKSAEAFTYCDSCDTNVIFYADVVEEAPLTATSEQYKNISTVYHYYTATVTYKDQTYTNKCVVVDPTCRHVGFTSYYGDVLIGNTVYNYPEYTKDFVMGSPWGKWEVKNKLAHVWVEEGKVGDENYKKYCTNCNLDYKNVATGDAIMISVIIMVLAGAAVVVMLTKKRRFA